MAISRAAAQTKRNAAVRAQHAAKTTHGAGSREHLASMEVTRGHGDDMRAAVARGDRSHSPEGAVHTADLDAGRTTGSSSGGSTASTSTSTSGGGGDSGPFVRTRMGYDPSGTLDYTNTNPAYWASAISYFRGKPEGNPATGELGIWIPNFEKEGAERTALAAIAGGVTAHADSNYSNKTVDDAKAKALHAARGDAAGAAGSYRGGAEKAIRLAGVHRGGTDATDRPMGSTASSEHGVYIKGGKVVKGAGVDYVKGGGDFGGLLSEGDTITGDWLTGILGAMDGDGMRIGGTYPSVRGATGSGVGAGGLATSVGSTYAGGVDPLSSMPGVSDYTAYMDPNSIFGGLSDNAAVKSGLLYQPMASDYGAKMEAAGMPSPGAGLLSAGSVGGTGLVGGGAGAPTYGSAPSGFSTGPSTTTAGSVGSVVGSAGTSYLWPEYFRGSAKSEHPIFSKDAPKFASEAALYDRFSDYSPFMSAYPESGGYAKVMDTGRVYLTGTGEEYTSTGFVPGRSYAAKT